MRLFASFLVLGLAVVAGGGAVAAEAEGGRGVELYFQLTAQIASTTLDARVEAGARLLMAPSEDGRRLSLVRPLEPAWKLYRVDPLGPGGEAKMAAEITLPEGSWRALEAAQAEVDEAARARWAAWRRQGWTEGQAFDGSFAFVVLGPPAGRFEVTLAPGGRIERVENRLTDRWRPGEIGSFFEGWSTRSGYWFWNAEAEPFAWEPHVYHGLVAALDLLAEDYRQPGEGGSDSRSSTGPLNATWDHADGELGSKIAGVLAILAPKTRGRLRAPDGAPVRVTRERALDEEGLATLDRLQATVRTRGGTVTLEVGFRPRAE